MEFICQKCCMCKKQKILQRHYFFLKFHLQEPSCLLEPLTILPDCPGICGRAILNSLSAVSGGSALMVVMFKICHISPTISRPRALNEAVRRSHWRAPTHSVLTASAMIDGTALCAFAKAPHILEDCAMTVRNSGILICICQ